MILRRTGARSPWLALAAILLAGGVLRGLYLAESVAKPDFSRPVADARFHDYWARALVSGDWSPPAKNPDPHIDTVPFVRPPVYPYFLALLYALTGKSYLGARILQMALGLVNCWLAYLLGCAVFRRSVGLVLAAMMAVYWALIYMEAELQAPVLLIAVSMLLFLTLNGWLRRGSWWRLALGGVLLGVMILVRPNAALFAPAVATWVWWHARRRLLPVVIVAAAAILAVLPATIRNLVVADDFVPITANGGLNLYLGNNPSADGMTNRFPDLQQLTGSDRWSCFTFDRIVKGVSKKVGRPLKYSEVDRYFLNRGLHDIAHAPGRFLRLTARRAALFWGPAEVANDKAVGVEKAESRILSLTPGFSVVLALALLGGGLLWRDRRRATPAGSAATAGATTRNPGPGNGPMLALALLYVGAVFVSFLPFLAAARYRIPILPFLFLFGAYGVVRVAATVSELAWGATVKLAAAAALLLFVCHIPLVAYDGNRAWWHTDRALALAVDGDLTGAIREYKAALKSNPGFVDAQVGLADALAASGRYAEAIRRYQVLLRHRPGEADACTGLADALTLSGHPFTAATLLRKLLASSPESARAHFELGRALGDLGKYEDAEREMRESLRLAPGHAFVHSTLGRVLARMGDHTGAIKEYRQALRMNPKDSETYCDLGASLGTIKSLAAADAAFEYALALQPGNVRIVEKIAFLNFKAGRMAVAARWYHRALKIDPNRAIDHGNLALALANEGRLPEAVAEMRIAMRLDPNNQAYAQRLDKIEAAMHSGG